MAKCTEQELLEFHRKLQIMEAQLAEEKKQIQEQRTQLARESQEWNKRKSQGQDTAQNCNTTEQGAAGPVTSIWGTIGSIREFSLNEDFETWYELFQQYIAANNISYNSERSVSLFLTLMGLEGYKVLRNLCVPQRPADKTLNELVMLIKNHISPQPNEIVERFKFYKRTQQPNESINAFLADLKKLSVQCGFEETLSISLRDQLVRGLRNERIQRRLLSERRLTLERAVDLSTSLETAEREVETLTRNPHGATDPSVNFLSKKKQQAATGEVTCFCCGKRNHKANVCRYKNFSCNTCGKKGHLAVVCKSSRKVEVKSNSFSRNVPKRKINKHNFIGDDCAETLNNLFNLSSDTEKPIIIQLLMEGQQTDFEVDSGSPVSAVSVDYVKKRQDLAKLRMFKSNRVFRSYSGSTIVPKGIIKVAVTFRDNNFLLDLFVLPGNSSPIVGRDWMNRLKIIRLNKDSLDICINRVSDKFAIEDVQKKFKQVFSGTLGKCKSHKLSLKLKDDAKPIFCKPRPVPFAMRRKIEKEIDRLMRSNIIEPVENSEWATPIVPVIKCNGDIRLCGDYKVTVNPQLVVNRYPIPRVNDLLCELKRGKIFSKLDLAHAYQQVELDEKSKDLTTISTHKGLFRYNRLSFGIASAPGLFQNLIEKILVGLNGVIVYLDDILVFGETMAEHNENLEKVLKRLENIGFSISMEKCFFAKERVNFLGYQLDGKGLHIAPEKIKAITQLAKPTSVTELRSFLGIVNYYAKFVKNFSSIAAPLFDLLKKNTKFIWSVKCDLAFNRIKEMLASYKTLTHYQTDLSLKISCDASPTGVGAVLAHVFPDGNEKPIAFASRALSVTEKKYSQLDKEALALVFAVRYFHQYIYGRKFILETDHKPLIYIFGSKKGIPQMAASRVQRWAVYLAAYDFDIRYIKGKDNIPADSLSRMLKESTREVDNTVGDYSYLNYVTDDVPSLNSREISIETAKDPVLKFVKHYIRNGWPDKIANEVNVFKKYDLQLTVEGECIMWGHRVVIPKSLRRRVLNELHSSHLGVVKTKMLARSYVWWPGLDSDIERTAKECKQCVENADNPPRIELHNWSWPTAANQRLHADFCGPIDGHMYLVIIDSYSKWVDVKEMPDIKAEATINAFREYFSSWGIPRVIVSDNGPTFTSERFQNFLKNNGVSQVLTAPYHPASNGAAENAVRHFKNKFKVLRSKVSRREALTRYLFAVRSSVHSTTGVTPAELQIGRIFRTRLDALKPTVRENVERKQEEQRVYFRGNRSIDFEPKERVNVKDYNSKQWVNATVESKCSPVTYTVRTENNKLWKRHADQMKAQCKLEEKSEEFGAQPREEPREAIEERGNLKRPIETNVNDTAVQEAASCCVSDNTADDVRARDECKQEIITEPLSIPRRSSRVRKPRKILDL